MRAKLKLVVRPTGVYQKPESKGLVCLAAPKGLTRIRLSRAGLSNQIRAGKRLASPPALSMNVKDLRYAY